MHLLRLSDGKRGHDNQSLGLAEALARAAQARLSTLTVDARGLLAAWAAARRAPIDADLVLGAGHGTHVALLLAARRASARSVVLMKPSLPRQLFDLCIIPEHDRVRPGPNVITSLGALNRIRPAAERDEREVLILLGGPSRHSGWDDARLAAQIERIADREPGRRLRLVASRRTPPATLMRLAAIERTVSMPFESTDPDWLPGALARATTVWVSEDSVSMAYEAASAGASVGLLSVPRQARGPGESRSARAARALVAAGRATRFDDWARGHALVAPAEPLAEAERCARAILERWPDLA